MHEEFEIKMKKILVFSCLVIMFVAGYFFAKYEVSSSQPAMSNVTDSTQQSSVSGVKTAKLLFPQKKNISRYPLPPANTPIAEILDMLKKRADVGDGKAACRLSIELLRCRQAKTMSKYMLDPSSVSDMFEGQLSNKEKLLVDNGQDEQRLKLLEKNKSCRNISDRQYDQIFKYLRQAAYSGEPDALIPYIDGLGLANGGDFSVIRGREFDIWRQDALNLAQSALHQGVPESVWMLSNGYSQDGSLFSGLVENDPYQAEVMSQLYFRVFAVTPAVVVNNLTPEQNALAGVQSEKIFQDYFHSQIRPRRNPIKSLLLATSLDNTAEAPCE